MKSTIIVLSLSSYCVTWIIIANVTTFVVWNGICSGVIRLEQTGGSYSTLSLHMQLVKYVHVQIVHTSLNGHSQSNTHNNMHEIRLGSSVHNHTE